MQATCWHAGVRGQAWISVDVSSEQVLDNLKTWWSVEGKDFIRNRFTEKVLEEAWEDSGEMRFDDDALDFEEVLGEEIPMSSLYEVELDEGLERPPEEIFTMLEDRHDAIVNLEKVMPGGPGDAGLQQDCNEADEEATNVEAEKLEQREAQGGSFATILHAVKDIQYFQESGKSFKGMQACLRRLEYLFLPMKEFVTRVRLAEGVLWETQRCEEPWSMLKHVETGLNNFKYLKIV